MQLTINVKPVFMSSITMFRIDSLDSFKNRITHGLCWTSAGFGTGYSPIRGGSTVRVFNLEKRRKKVELIKPKKWTKKELVANGYLPTDVKYTTRKVVSPSHWVAYVYDFDIKMLKAAGLKVVQGARTFKLVPINQTQAINRQQT